MQLGEGGGLWGKGTSLGSASAQRWAWRGSGPLVQQKRGRPSPVRPSRTGRTGGPSRDPPDGCSEPLKKVDTLMLGQDARYLSGWVGSRPRQRTVGQTKPRGKECFLTIANGTLTTSRCDAAILVPLVSLAHQSRGEKSVFDDRVRNAR